MSHYPHGQEHYTLPELRLLAGLSKAQAAELCGVSLRTWLRWERDKPSPPMAVPRLLSLTASAGAMLENGSWAGWSIARDGKLYGPDDPYHGVTPNQIYAVSLCWQTFDALSQRLRWQRGPVALAHGFASPPANAPAYSDSRSDFAP